MLPDDVARFRRDLGVFVPVPAADGPLGIAVSGGPDSMALLALAHAAFPGAVTAATVDHRLRPQSAAEAAMVARWCADRNVPHITLPANEDLAGPDLQARARALRYRLLGRWAAEERASAIATAHHADDQAETFLMRAVRGSGPAGLAGIRATRSDGALRIVRPLLGWRRAELRALVLAAGVPFVDDPSNADPKFERVRVRQLLADAPWLDAGGLARAAAHVGESEEALCEVTDWLLARRIVTPADRDREVWLELADLPRALRRRVAREAMARVRLVLGLPPPDPATNIESLLDALEAGAAATQGPVVARAAGTIWRFAKAPPRRSR